eukprot:TRINITY_DN13854_c0_g1_i1.p1 TRINITY_DN13854_c0_g1~~TRINITY_DN13854_c0_g1_i1.p1  ORF type:complete len:406 (-),score=128.66 TRINITY_DN13854_c0_g1_i1:186-1403(-)
MKGGKSSLRRTYGRGDDGDDANTRSVFSWSGVSSGKGKGGRFEDDEPRGHKRPFGRHREADEDSFGFGGKGIKGFKDGYVLVDASQFMDAPWMMAEMGVKGKGKAGKWPRRKPAKEPEPAIECKYDGVVEAMTACVAPIAHLDTKWDEKYLIEYLVGKVEKAAEQLEKDERLTSRGSQMLAVAVLEDLVEGCMQSLAQKDSTKAWYNELDIAPPLKAAAMGLFQNSKLFSRMLAPMMDKYVEEAIFRFKEEERFQHVIWDTVAECQVADKYQKKTNQFLLKAYDDAHTQAEFGSSEADEPALGVVQDFVKCWMTLFISRAWDILESGVGNNTTEQAAFVTKLFQTILHPEKCCLPHDLVSSLSNPLPAEWDYVNEVACLTIAEANAGGEKKTKKTWQDWNASSWK